MEFHTKRRRVNKAIEETQQFDAENEAKELKLKTRMKGSKSEADNNLKGAVANRLRSEIIKKIGRGTGIFGYSRVGRSSYKSNFGEIVCKSSRSASQSSCSGTRTEGHRSERKIF